MTQMLLPMLKKESGAIVNISSEAGFLGRPGHVGLRRYKSRFGLRHENHGA